MLANSLSSARSGARPCAAARRPRCPPRHSAVRTKALFGWGKKNEEEDAYDAKEEEMRAMQELLAKRRSGVLIKEANDRRQKVQETLKSKQDLRRAEKQALAEGRVPETLANWRPYDKETEDKASKPGIIVPLLPFGIKKYDEGERFDLRSPYADEGWVDPEETDMWAGFKAAGQKLLNFGQYKEVKNKPVVWASQYDKYVADQKAKKEAEAAERAAEAEGKGRKKK